MFTPCFSCLRNTAKKASYGTITWTKLSEALKRNPPKTFKKTIPPRALRKPAKTPEPFEKPPPPPQLPVKQRYPNLQYEERIIQNRDHPIRVSIYHPHPISRSSSTKILYLPSAHTTFFPPPEKVISLLSNITSATVIIPILATTINQFPQPLHDLLQVYDHFNSDPSCITPTAILATGIAAPIAAAVAVTEPVAALGVWGGVLDLTTHAKRATAWNQELELWDHFPPPPSPVLEETPRLGMTENEFITLRRRYFPNPETWPDPFASPHLFFRSSCIGFSRLPPKENTEGQAEGNQTKVYERKPKATYEVEGYVSPHEQHSLLQKYPPWNRQDPFPKIRIVIPAVDERDDITAQQGIKFKESAKSCLIRWMKGKGLDQEDVEIDVNMMLSIERLMAGEGWESEVAAMGHWLKLVFSGESQP